MISILVNASLMGIHHFQNQAIFTPNSPKITEMLFQMLFLPNFLSSLFCTLSTNAPPSFSFTDSRYSDSEIKN